MLILKKNVDDLYIGEGRHFYKNQKYKLEDVPEYFRKYFDETEDELEDDEKHTKVSLKALKKEGQINLLVELGLNPEDYTNEEERIEAILTAQEGE